VEEDVEGCGCGEGVGGLALDVGIRGIECSRLRKCCGSSWRNSVRK
jgi:hypothetical protein